MTRECNTTDFLPQAFYSVLIFLFYYGSLKNLLLDHTSNRNSLYTSEEQSLLHLRDYACLLAISPHPSIFMRMRVEFGATPPETSSDALLDTGSYHTRELTVDSIRTLLTFTMSDKVRRCRQMIFTTICTRCLQRQRCRGWGMYYRFFSLTKQGRILINHRTLRYIITF